MDNENNYLFPVELKDQVKLLKDGFWKCLYTSAEQEMLYYWILLPHTVKPVEVEPVVVQNAGLINIGRYITTQDNAPYIEVWAYYEHCPWEMNASDWLINKLGLIGEQILHQRILTHLSGSGKFADILTRKKMPSGDEVISRYTVQKDYNRIEGGGNYFLMKTACEAKDYNTLADTIFLIAVDWDLMHRSNMMLSESLKTVSFSEKNNSGFKIPGSWQVNVFAENRLVVQHTFNDINHGVINLFLYPLEEYQSEHDIFNMATARLNRHDSTLSWTPTNIVSVPNDFNTAFIGDLYHCTGELLSQQRGYSIKSMGDLYHCTGELLSATEKIRVFYQMYIFKINKFWCYVDLVGPYPNHENYYYEANVRCLEIILLTFRLENA